MQYILAVFFIAVLTVILAAAGCRRSPAGSSTDSPSDPPNITAPAKTAQNRLDDLRKKLHKLKDSPPPKKLNPGAMCYEMVGPPSRIEYICPECGSKTLYAETPEKEGEVKASHTLIWQLQSEIPKARRIAGTIKDIEIKLKESGFCNHCSPGAEKRSLDLTVTVDGKEHTTENISFVDLQLISEFLKGSLVHEGGAAGETPLKQYADRIEQLLGLKSD